MAQTQIQEAVALSIDLKSRDAIQAEAELRLQIVRHQFLQECIARYAQEFPPPSWASDSPRVVNTNKISDLTHAATTRLLRDKEYMRTKRVVAAVDRVYARLDAQCKRVLELVYWQDETDAGAALEVGVSPRTIERRREEIVAQALAEFQLSGVSAFER